MATTDTATATTPTAGDAVLTPDNALHMVTDVHGEALELACGLLAVGLPVASDPALLNSASVCSDCANGRTNPQLEPDVTANQAIAEAVAGPNALQPNPEVQALIERPATVAEAAASVANQPTRAAVASKLVGSYKLEQPKKDGPFRLRDVDSAKMLPEAFDNVSDAAWYAQRRTRLRQFVGFGGTRKLFMPKVPATIGEYTIEGELGKVRVLRNGEQVGPTWTHATNGRVDAMRWIERLGRPTRGA